MSPAAHDNDLTSLLRCNDPLLDEPGLGVLETAEMRRTVLAEIPEETRHLWRQLSPAMSVALLLAVALGVAWWPSFTEPTSPVSVPVGEATVHHESPSVEPGIQRSGNALENRKIQFETPGGTLVVWVLNPNFPS